MSDSKDRIEIADGDDVARYAAPTNGGGDIDADAAQAEENPLSETEQLQREVKELRDQLLRARAETANVARRVNDEKAQFAKYANERFAAEMLPVWDNLERALSSVTEAQMQDPVIKGVQMVYEQFKSAMAAQGVEPIKALNQPFDPSVHEALLRQPTSEHAVGTVIQEYERGYRMRDRVLRAAKVVVAAAPQDEAQVADGDDDGADS